MRTNWVWKLKDLDDSHIDWRAKGNLDCAKKQIFRKLGLEFDHPQTENEQPVANLLWSMTDSMTEEQHVGKKMLIDSCLSDVIGTCLVRYDW